MSYDDLLQPDVAESYLMIMEEGSSGGSASANMATLTKATGLKMASSADFSKEAAMEAATADAGGIYFDEFDIAVVKPAGDQVSSLSALAGKEGVMAMEPNLTMYAVGAMPSSDYLAGLKEGISRGAGAALSLFEEQVGSKAPAAAEAVASKAAYNDTAAATWGIQAIGADKSRYTGKGIKVAVLDTGFATQHPDFAGRAITTQSFIKGESVEDGNGHGTHCIGTACGPVQHGQHPRYGVAPEAEIFAGKVLSNQGSGSSSGIIEGIRWAVNNGCEVISMSLGSPTRTTDNYMKAYERVAQRALARGSLIVAAAGNESYRPNRIAPVSSPANCPSIMAVAAIDHFMNVAYFSCGDTSGKKGSEVNIAGPGVDIFSSWPPEKLYNSISGTSMATPHVAGVAALMCQADPSLRGVRLWQQLERSASGLSAPARDVGQGLVQAP